MEALANIVAILLQAFVSYAQGQGTDVTPEEIAEKAKKYAGRDLDTLNKIAAEHLKRFQAGSAPPDLSEGDLSKEAPGRASESSRWPSSNL